MIILRVISVSAYDNLFSRTIFEFVVNSTYVGKPSGLNCHRHSIQAPLVAAWKGTLLQ